MKKFLDRLPRVISAKAPQAKRQDTQTYQTTAKLLEASVAQRVVSMRYHSQESGREKEYLVHPYRLVHAQGGLYLIAFVPAYSEVRTFAVERVRRATLQEQTFEPVAELDSDPFKNSLGVHRGPAMKVQLRFHPQIAASIKERTWHASQRFKDRADGSVMMTLRGLGRLRAPQLASRLRPVRAGARAGPTSSSGSRRNWIRRASSTAGGDRARVADSDIQPGLPFLFNRLVNRVKVRQDLELVVSGIRD